MGLAFPLAANAATSKGGHSFYSGAKISGYSLYGRVDNQTVGPIYKVDTEAVDYWNGKVGYDYGTYWAEVNSSYNVAAGGYVENGAYDNVGSKFIRYTE